MVGLTEKQWQSSPLRYRLLPATRPEAPVLLAIAPPDGEVAGLIRFCRRIAPGAAILIPQLDRGGTPLARIAAIMAGAIATHGLSLQPVVAIGHGEGADLAANLALHCGHLLTACLLLRPTAYPVTAAGPGIDGLAVLLCLAGQAADAAAERLQWRRILGAAGAQLVCEPVPPRRRPGGGDAAICRVFLAALFGAPCGAGAG